MLNYPLEIHTHFEPLVVGVPVTSGPLYLTKEDKVIGESFDVTSTSQSVSNPYVTFGQNSKTIIIYGEDIIIFNLINLIRDLSVSSKNIIIPTYPLQGTGFNGDLYTLVFTGYKRTSGEPIQYNYILNKTSSSLK